MGWNESNSDVTLPKSNLDRIIFKTILGLSYKYYFILNLKIAKKKLSDKIVGKSM